MDEFARAIGYAVLGIAVLYAILRAASASPAFGRLLKFAGLLMWGVLALGWTVLAFVAQIAQGNHWTAVATVIVGAIFYVPWIALGLPAVLHMLGLRSRPTWGSRL